MKHLMLFILLLAFSGCASSRHVVQPELTAEQRQHVKDNGGFNPYYVSPDYQKIKMPKRPKR